MSKFREFLQPSLKSVQNKETHSEKEHQSSNETLPSEITHVGLSVQSQSSQLKDVFERLGGNLTEVSEKKTRNVTIQSHKRNRPEKDQVEQKKQSARFSQQWK